MKLVSITRLPTVVFAIILGSFTQMIFAAEPILIGLSITRSPPGSVIQGTQIKDAMEIYADMINAKGGLLGRPVKLVIEDNQGLPEKGRSAVEKLITKDKVVAITGSHQSSVCLSEIEVAHRYQTPYVNTNCWADSVRIKGYPEVINTSPYNFVVADSMAETLKAMKVKRVVAFAENTDYGIGLAKGVGEALKRKGAAVDYKFETLDRSSKDFTPAILALKANPPDVIVMTMLPPAAYIALNQLYEQGVAPSPKTLVYDGAGMADYPDFWQNVKEAGKYMMTIGMYHPDMKMNELSKQIAVEYKKRTNNDPNRLIYQAVDSLLVITEAIRQAGTTDSAKLLDVMRKSKFDGARGVMVFDSTPGVSYQQWAAIPYVNYQLTDVNQAVGKTTLLQSPGTEFNVQKITMPK
jgi:ABC-type branched-subunit amino acid transport system substrate-binding protein